VDEELPRAGAAGDTALGFLDARPVFGGERDVVEKAHRGGPGVARHVLKLDPHIQPDPLAQPRQLAPDQRISAAGR
jgi:hypothetical protein